MLASGFASLLFVPLAFALRPVTDVDKRDAPLLLHVEGGTTHIAINPGSSSVLLHLGENHTTRNRGISTRQLFSAAMQNRGGCGGPCPGGQARNKGVDMKTGYIGLLFKLIDAEDGGKQGNGQIDYNEWYKKVTGPWSGVMWQKMLELDREGDGNSDGQISGVEFQNFWDPAVSAAFCAMGGDDNDITPAEIDGPGWGSQGAHFGGASQDEKSLAKSPKFMEDGKMDGGEFEEFLYTAMVFRSMDPNGDGTVTWDEVESNALALTIFGGAAKEQAWKERVGSDGMQVGELYDIFVANSVFIQNPDAC